MFIAQMNLNWLILDLKILKFLEMALVNRSNGPVIIGDPATYMLNFDLTLCEMT